MRSKARLGWIIGFAASAALSAGVAAGEQERKTLAIAPQYQASGFHRFLWGSDYRALWATPITLDVLDLKSFAGGLTPAFRVGGQQTRGLAFRGADGRDYTFRSLDKDPTEILPEELRDTFARSVIQDQMAASHPLAPLIVEELMQAAGILHTRQWIVVMPDDPALGAFRAGFAGVVGQFYEFPGAVSERNPGFQGATAVLKHKDFYALMQRSSDTRPDVRALLKARLFDLMIGDWDRHRDQWRWAQMPGNPLWQPIPDDRDQAFSRYEGLILDLARGRDPRFQEYGPRYSRLRGLTWNGREQDRQLLVGLDQAQWREVAAELQGQVSDAVIERAARRLPPEHFALDGARLMRDLRARRDQLLQGALRFYALLAAKVDVYLTDEAESVEASHGASGDLLVRALRQGADGSASGGVVYERRFLPAETEEVRLYLRAGNDRLVTQGRPGRVRLRVIGGDGLDVVDDSHGGGTRLYDVNGEIRRGPGSSHDDREYAQPAGPKNAPWIPPRDWGRSTFFVPWLSYGSDLGVFAGVGVDTQAFGFRSKPYANRHIVRLGWAFGEGTLRADYRGEFRFENRGLYARLGAQASGIETQRFYGYGNDTGGGADTNSEFFRVSQQQYSLAPALVVPLLPKLTLSVGPRAVWASTTHEGDTRLINALQPYGYSEFGEIGAAAMLELDTREALARSPGGVALREMGYPRNGFLVRARGAVYPKLWDVEEAFGSVEGSAAAYLTAGGERAPTLALRAGGKHVFGSFPFHEAAYLGGGLRGEELVRGLPRHRYAGNGAVYANADLRLYVSRFKLLLPGDWGLLGFADVGRVYVAGEESDTWHRGYGGGLWFAWLDRANTVSLSWARAEGTNAYYVRAGFGF